MKNLVEGPHRNVLEEVVAVSVALLVLAMIVIAFFAFLTFKTATTP